MNKLIFLLLTAFIAPHLAGAQQRLPASPQRPIPPNPGQSSAPAVPSKPYWQQQVDYSIDVSLRDADHTLDGFIQIKYTNNSPDTLNYIWIHCWPNAYKNDRTAFSEQLLGNGRTDFYFSDKQQKGYINHLEFRVDGQLARMEDHPQYIDIIKVLLPNPLPPGGRTTLTTPFHVRLPYNFSRGGYVAFPDSPPNVIFRGNSSKSGLRPRPSGPSARDAYQVTQWYPKPAVYDSRGWHPIPYLDQGEFYSEFGDFDVRITVPKNFIVAATGELQDSTPAKTTKTLRYRQNNIHDFAWFADPRFVTHHDTLQLASGRIIDVYSFYTPAATPAWGHSIEFIKDAIRFRSALIGEYPYNVVTAVETKMGTSGGMEYPTITSINDQGSAKQLELTIEHEVGHNWFYGILGTNERRYPWMDEGINTYYDNRYEAWKYPPAGNSAPRHADNSWLLKKIPSNLDLARINTLAAIKKDQPISTPSEDFTENNYNLIAYAKTGLWMQMLQASLGTPLFDSCMRQYYNSWQFQHPYPEDLKSIFTHTSHRPLDTIFSLLDKKGPLTPFPSPRKIRPTFLFNIRNADKIDYINILPAAGYNDYDQFMAGVLIHNFNLPPEPFRFLLAPLYATGSRQLNGLGHLAYSWYPEGPPAQNPSATPSSGTSTSGVPSSAEARHPTFSQIEAGTDFSRFSSSDGTDSSGQRLFGGFYKVVPFFRLHFSKPSPRSTQDNWLEWKTYLIGEKDLNNYVQKSTDSLYYPTAGKYDFRYLNQLSLNIGNERVLYPYNILLQAQQAARFYRINLTAKYFFNYEKGGGLDIRIFGAKFGYLGGQDPSLDLTSFEPKLTAVRGSEDYTYDNYFIGRNEFDGKSSQQIMMRDGDLKLRTDLFQGLQGRSDNWVASLNLATTLPRKVFPEWIPLKIFLDIGTYAQAWQANPPTAHFLYVGGLELNFFHDVFRVYAPIVYSSDFSNQLKTVPGQNGFSQKLSFSIDFQNIKFRKIFGNTPF